MGAHLRNPVVLALCFGHLAVDMFSSALPVLLVLVGSQLGLTNVGIGTVITLYIFGSSLTQPLFGLLADRWNSPWVGVGGVLWQAGCFALAPFLPTHLTPVAFIIGALGSGAYHPYGSMQVRRASGEAVGSGTSLFFCFGMAGHAIGPILAGILLTQTSLPVSVGTLALLVLPIALVLGRVVPSTLQPTERPRAGTSNTLSQLGWSRTSIGAFVLVLIFGTWASAATSTFLPKWFADAGFDSEAYGALLGAFMAGSAIGNILGGWLGDRWSRRGVIVLAMAIAPLPFSLLYIAPIITPSTVAFTILAGICVGMPNSVFLLLGQSLLPGRMGFASGLVLGFMFSATAVTGWLTGWLGDSIGLHQALSLTPWTALVAAASALALPRSRPQPTPAPLLSKAS